MSPNLKKLCCSILFFFGVSVAKIAGRRVIYFIEMLFVAVYLISTNTLH